MRRFRETKRRARGDLHREMSVPALYIATPTAVPVAITVRDHTKFAALGALPGGGSQYAERQEVTPKLILLVSEMPAPKRLAVISIEPGEAYRIENVEPPYGITITITVVKLSAAEAAGLAVPA